MYFSISIFILCSYKSPLEPHNNSIEKMKFFLSSSKKLFRIKIKCSLPRESAEVSYLSESTKFSASLAMPGGDVRTRMLLHHTSGAILELEGFLTFFFTVELVQTTINFNT